jgi:hypothetical protein
MSGTDPLAALRHAATVLLAEAPLPVVRATLRALLADTEAVAAPPPARPDPPAAPPLPRKPRLQPKATPKLKPTDGEWDTRRREIRTAMLDRGVGYPDLANKFGVAVRTLRHAVGRREPPTRVMRQRLEAWLEDDPAPAVAAEPPFRSNGAGKPHDAAARASAG